jgi:DNA-binding CsgD family transcriptional regulator
MDLYARAPRLIVLETALADPSGSARLAALVELAWHLRQRDSLRALQLAEEATRQLEQEPAPRDAAVRRSRLALTRCEVATLFCRIDEAGAWLAQAQVAVEVDPAAEIDLALAEAQLAKARGQRARVVEHCRRAAQAGPRAADALRTAAAWAWLDYEQANLGGAEVAQPPGAQADHPAVDALVSAAAAMRAVRREPSQAVALFLRASEQAQRVGLVREAVVATVNAGTTLRGLGEHDRAAACFDVAESVARQTAWPMLLGTCRTQLGAFLSAQGRLEEAQSVLIEAHAALAPTPAGVNRANACQALAEVLLRLQRPVDALGPGAEAIRMYRAAGSMGNLVLALAHQAVVLSELDRSDEALQALGEAEALMAQHHLPALRLSLHRALAAIHRRHTLNAPAEMTAPTPALHFGERALAEGALIEGWKAPSSELAALAEGWAAAGDIERAWNHARAAMAAMRAEMAVLQRPSVQWAPLRQAQAPPPVDAAGLWHPAFGPPRAPAAELLTPKERHVLALLARGYTNKEIALTLELAEETVKWHLKKVFGKLDVASRKQAVARARALGILALDA